MYHRKQFLNYSIFFSGVCFLSEPPIDENVENEILSNAILTADKHNMSMGIIHHKRKQTYPENLCTLITR